MTHSRRAALPPRKKGQAQLGAELGTGSRIVWLFVQTSPVPGPRVSQVYGSSKEMTSFDLLLWANGLNEFEMLLIHEAKASLQ